MRKLAKYTLPEIVQGTTRLQRVFSFWPTRVENNIIWLETYEILEAYILLDYKVRLEGVDKAFRVGEWKQISKRLIHPTVNIKQ